MPARFCAFLMQVPDPHGQLSVLLIMRRDRPLLPLVISLPRHFQHAAHENEGKAHPGRQLPLLFRHLANEREFHRFWLAKYALAFFRNALLAPGGFHGGVQGVEHLVGDGDRLAGRRIAQRGQAGVALGLGCGGEDLGAADLGGGGLLGRVGDFPVRVVGRGGVGVQGVQGEVGAGVAEVVLLPPP